MLTSLFSPFDALLAGAIGQKVGLSRFSRATEVAAEAKHAAASDPKGASTKEAVKKDREVSSAPPPSPHVKKRQNQQQGQQRRMPRFAVELDGVDWFETIVPY